MKNKTVTAEQAVSGIKDGAVIMFGGFLGCGTPEVLIDALLEKGVKDITVICNDTATPTTGVGRLVAAKRVRKVIASHIGTNPETGAQMNSGETEVELIPQGTLAERIRCAGYGLGGVLTPTGLGTEAEKGKEVIVSDGKSYLLEKASESGFCHTRCKSCRQERQSFLQGDDKEFSASYGDGSGYRYSLCREACGNGRDRSRHSGYSRYFCGLHCGKGVRKWT